MAFASQEIEELLRKEMQAHQDGKVSLGSFMGELQHLAHCEGYRLVFCGHSMGGAVSAMCVAMLRDKAASYDVGGCMRCP